LIITSSATREAVIAASENVIENPVTGERIVIHRSADDTDGAVLAWELVLAPGGRVPSSHAHPAQEERFTVVEGKLNLRIGSRPVVAGPGRTVAIPPGTVHSFANLSDEPVRVLVETRPALAMAELLATAAAMAQQQRSTSRLLPNPVHLALFMRDFHREVRAPYLPVALVRLVTGAVATLARWCGLDAGYRRLRVRGADR
jgi:quercetin dioxygenase-like cupin family protein